MAADPSSLRRRAAYAVLSNVLNEAALMDALTLLHTSLRSDNVTDVIRYIDTVARRHDIDAASAKRLYPAYFAALKRSDDELPLDPLPLMGLTTARTAMPAPPPPVVAAPVPAAVPVPVPVPVPVAAPVAPPAPIPEPAPPEVPLAPEILVHAALMKHLIEDLQHFHGDQLDPVRQDLLVALDKARLPASLKDQVRTAWTAPLTQAWRIEAMPGELAELVHLLYIALCENLGPVDADRVLTAAVQQADRLPEARRYSPRKFL
jgi:hypothetical protein